MTNYNSCSDWETLFTKDMSTWDIVTRYASRFSNELLEKIHLAAIPTAKPIKDECLTNCVTNTVALSVLFTQGTRNIIGALALEGDKEIFIQGDSHVIQMNVNNLSIGSAVCLHTPSQIEFGEDGSYDISELAKACKRIDRQFVIHLQSVLKSTPLNSKNIAKKYLGDIYDFNRRSYDFLIQDLKKNADLVTSEKGFIYHLAIQSPKGDGFIHCLVLEQFMNEHQRVRYRVYQSFIDLYSLEDSLKLSEAKNVGRAGMDQDAFEIFLKHFEVIVCASCGSSSITRSDAYQYCFNSTPTAKAQQKIYIQNDREIDVQGISFRYHYSVYDKKKVLDNIYSFLKQHSLLELFLKPIKKTHAIDSLIQKQFFQDKNKNVIPFKIIHFLSSKCLKIIIQTVLLKVNESYHNRPETKLTTSCVNTAFTVAALFLGFKKAQEILQCLYIDPNFETACTLPSGKIWKCSVWNLFSGIALCNIRKANKLHDVLNSKKADVTPFVKSEIEVFSRAVRSNVLTSISTLGEEFSTVNLSNMKYENNSTVIANLKKELFTNESRVTSAKSYIYFVASLTNKTPRNFDHTFVLEQFLRESDQQVCYRRYQSWIGKATLFDDIQKEWYGEEGENAITRGEMVIFLQNLSDLYGYSGKGSYEKCFGYQGPITRPILKFEMNQFTAMTVSYIAYEIDPSDCLDHLATIIKSNTELEEMFSRENQFK